MVHRRLGWFLLSLCVSAVLLTTACGRHKSAEITGPEGMAGPRGTGATGFKAKSDKVSVCHTDELGVKSVVAVNGNALAAHLAHGDVQLVDDDGDGWVQVANECVPGGDCNDQDPAVHGGSQERCNGIDDDCDGEVDEGLPVIASQSGDILRDQARLSESAMGNLVADAMRLGYSGVDAAMTNSGGLRQDLLFAPSLAGENAGEILCRELFPILPFGNRAVILTITGAQLEQAFVNGLTPACDPGVSTGRFPQVSGLKVSYSCNGTTPTVTGMWKTPQGIGGPQIPIGPTDTIRLVTNDFMANGGDGYTVLQSGTDVVLTGDLLLEILSAHVAANSPVSATVQGRIVRE